MRKKMILVLMALAAMVSSAASENVSVGQYVISFDLENAISDYSIEKIAENKTVERYDGSTYNQSAISIHGPGYSNDNTTDYTLIIVNRDEDPWYLDSYSLESDIGDLIDDAGYSDVETYPRSIDGCDTFLGVGSFSWRQTLYYTKYYPNCSQSLDGDSYCLGNTEVAILSVQSWDVVAPLLRTIHVELPNSSAYEVEPAVVFPDPNLEDAVRDTPRTSGG